MAKKSAKKTSKKATKTPSARISTTSPLSVGQREVTIDWKRLPKILTKITFGVAAQKWEAVVTEALNLAGAVGLKQPIEEIGGKLVLRSITAALASLLGPYEHKFKKDSATLSEDPLKLLTRLSLPESVEISPNFFKEPKSLQEISKITIFLEWWLNEIGFSKLEAKSISARFPRFFTVALIEEWRANVECYEKLRELSIDIPFINSNEKDLAWDRCHATLIQSVEESVFDEAFSLSQIYVALSGWITVEEGGAPQEREKIFRRILLEG